jgi:hypothetical protein
MRHDLLTVGQVRTLAHPSKGKNPIAMEKAIVLFCCIQTHHLENCESMLLGIS